MQKNREGIENRYCKMRYHSSNTWRLLLLTTYYLLLTSYFLLLDSPFSVLAAPSTIRNPNKHHVNHHINRHHHRRSNPVNFIAGLWPAPVVELQRKGGNHQH